MSFKQFRHTLSRIRVGAPALLALGGMPKPKGNEQLRSAVAERVYECDKFAVGHSSMIEITHRLCERVLVSASAHRPKLILSATSHSDSHRWRSRVNKSDTQLQKDILAELAWQPSINAAQIGVEVNDGIVTLAGHVNSYAEKWDAEQATQRVAGVKALAVEMDVRLEGTNNRTDADIARSVENVLQWTTYLTKDAVKVKVEGGWVTLTGEVDWQYQRQAATAAIRYMMGVSGVSDQITIRTRVSAPVVKSDIEAALKRRAQLDARDISVSVHGTDVTLTGSVHSWSERELARNTAWGTPGVRNVVDNTTLSY